MTAIICFNPSSIFKKQERPVRPICPVCALRICIFVKYMKKQERPVFLFSRNVLFLPVFAVFGCQGVLDWLI